MQIKFIQIIFLFMSIFISSCQIASNPECKYPIKLYLEEHNTAIQINDSIIIIIDKTASNSYQSYIYNLKTSVIIKHEEI